MDYVKSQSVIRTYVKGAAATHVCVTQEPEQIILYKRDVTVSKRETEKVLKVACHGSHRSVSNSDNWATCVFSNLR